MCLPTGQNHCHSQPALPARACCPMELPVLPANSRFPSTSLTAGSRSYAARNDTSGVRAKLALKFQLRLVLFQKLAEFVGGIQQAVPLLVIKGHRETAETVHAHSAFFSHAKFQASGTPGALLLFEIRKTRFQFL